MFNFVFIIFATCMGILNYFDTACLIAFCIVVAREFIICYNTRNETELWH